MVKDITHTFNRKDLFQVIIGSAALTLPVAFSEESWILSQTLAWIKNKQILVVTCIII